MRQFAKRPKRHYSIVLNLLRNKNPTTDVTNTFRLFVGGQKLINLLVFFKPPEYMRVGSARN